MSYHLGRVEKLTWRKIADELAEKIESGEMPAGTRIESEEGMASRLNIPRHVAHRALDELHRKGLVIRQRRWGTVVADQKPADQMRIAYLVDVAANRFQSELMGHIEHALEPGSRLVVATSRNDPDREAEHLMNLRNEVDGIICYPADGDANSRTFLDIAKSGFPLVLVDRAPRGCEELVVMTDNVGSSERAVSDLVERGHQRIAFFGSSNDRALSIRERYVGYRNVVDRLDYSVKSYERWIPLLIEENSELMYQTISDGFTVMRSLAEPPTAAFCVQDRLAAILIEVCAAQNVEVGVDFGIATYNDFGPTFFSQPWRLNRVVQRLDQIGTAAVERLYAQIRRQAIEKGPVRIEADFIASPNAATLIGSGFPQF